jgi:pyruvate dehydrogenase E2 component (dihydrolipoamide acetyltransferase)
MPVSVTMPRLGESVSEGTVTRWLKKEGERVEADEPLLEVSTDKVDTEIPAPASGVLQSIKVAEDETVEVGVELAVISDSADGDAGGATATEEPAEQQPPAEEAAPPQQREEVARDATPEPEPEPEPAAAPEPAPAEQETPAEATPRDESTDAADGGGTDPAYVTPLVRRLASEQGVDLAQVTGTGVGGRIRKQDVLDAARAGGARAPAAAAPASAPAAPAAASTPQRAPAAAPAAAPVDSTAHLQARGRTEKMSRLRAVIAARMVESLQVAAQLTTVLEVDVTRIASLRQRAKRSFEQREGVKLSFLPFFAVATCEALKAHPAVNASIDVDKGEITYHDAEHLGIAVDTDRGLLVPVIRDAGDLNLGGMARKIADLADRTRSGKVTPDELGGGTFTLTNTGSRGALFDTPIINQPQVGILGTGAVVKRPVVIDDPNLGESLAIRSMVYLSLTYDHRLVDGADAARFLVTVKERLEEGAFEADLGL